MLAEVAYLTDVEGNLAYFDRWVLHSRVLRYAPSSPTRLELTHANAHFVYGGDVVDRGDGNRRLLERLVRLKQDFPSRVHLLAGNRDLNKLRFSSELSDADMARPYTSIPKPHWSPSVPSLAEHLEDLSRRLGTPAAALDSRAERLRYYYTHTLGCPTTFEMRRAELALLSGRQPQEVSDEEVVEEARADVMPNGVMRQYLECAELAVILGNTLFVHGAIDAATMGVVPDDSTPFSLPTEPYPVRRVDGVHEWAAAMNAFLRRGLADHAARPEWDEARTARGGEQLLAVQNREASWGRTIVSNCYCDGGTITSTAAALRRAEFLSRPPSDAFAFAALCSDPRDQRVADWLASASIRRVVVGHKPSGDSPAVLSSRYTGVELISADTSYADPQAADGRGQSVACVLLRGPSLDENHSLVYGTLADGRRHEARLATLGGAADGEGGDPHVGVELEDGWWVKARLCEEGAGGGARYVCCRGAGREVEYKEVPEEELVHAV
ncbi:hypothetical protein AB1Y20_012289 [Prymnesium parvum]|uniref:Calcineurin-like phosphoesterase domain-containing protein n=1 Tax=Prymnesium parvum TaxID=97485 RepID=A0AB34IQT7_PRYPA